MKKAESKLLFTLSLQPLNISTNVHPYLLSVQVMKKETHIGLFYDKIGEEKSQATISSNEQARSLGAISDQTC